MSDQTINEMETQFSTDIHSVRDEMATVHPDAVFDWRRDEFATMGFKLATATWLAKTKIELRAMERLISQGCPLDLAIGILIGTDAMGRDEEIVTHVIEVDDADDDSK